MVKTSILLPDGKTLSSGNPGESAILSRTITKLVNDQAYFSPGSVCSFMFEARILAPEGRLSIPEGSEITVFEDDFKIGVFQVEKPTRQTANTFHIVGYDRTCNLDKDVTEWFNSLDAWPYTLYKFASMLCEECGLKLKNTSIPNGSRKIRRFEASGITGRTLMKYVAQACCRFGRATPDGLFELGWYKDSGKEIGTRDFYLNSLSYEDYETLAIDNVRIRATEDDVGTSYPGNGGNTYIITANPILGSVGSDALTSSAKTVYDQVSGVRYTPCKCTLFYPSGVDVGDIVHITDRNGKRITAYVMSSTVTGYKQVIECLGSYSQTSITKENNKQIIDKLYGKMTEIQTSVEGVNVRVSEIQTEYQQGQKNTETKIAELSVKADGIAGTVTKQAETIDGIRTEMTQVQQSAQEVSVTVQGIVDNGVKKVTTEFGLTIDESCVEIHRKGNQITNSLDETGMYVIRNKEKTSETVMLKANADGVEAENLTARKFLGVGSHCRFEDYSNGSERNLTGCFWVPGD